MLLKSADGKDAEIAILTNLANHANIPDDKRQLINRELRNVVTGAKTEKDAAIRDAGDEERCGAAGMGFTPLTRWWPARAPQPSGVRKRTSAV